MPFKYNKPPTDFPLKQGEILGNLIEFRVRPEEPNEWMSDEEKAPSVVRRIHSYSAIITQACDLDGDWQYRNDPEKTKKDKDDERKLLQNISFCDIFTREEIRNTRGFNSRLWERINPNQDERYHCFKEGIIGETEAVLPSLYVDFKWTFSLPTEYVYTLISNSITKRIAIIPDFYMQDFVHRLYTYLARVAIPD